MAVVLTIPLKRILSKCRVLYSIARTITTTSRCSASHYDVLGITQKATQGDIKTAYYKLSKMYHPDISADEASARKFRAISEAYEVLGNIKLKKMYDKGLLVGRANTTHVEYQPEPEPTDPTLKFYKSHAHRHVTPTMDGRKPIYDFDSWSKQHYGDLFQKSQYDKEALRKKRFKEMDTVKSNRQEAFLYIIFAIGGLFLVLVAQGKEDYDRDMTAKRAQEKLENNNKE